MNDFMALLRRILGDSGEGYGELILITQLGRRIDINARELCTSVHYHVCHYKKTCSMCGYSWDENNEKSEPAWRCKKCNDYRIKKHSHVIEVWHFNNMRSYEYWAFRGVESYYRHYYVTDIEKYFPYYNTLQWDNLLSNY